MSPPEGKSVFQWGFEKTLRRIQSPERSVCVVLDVPTMKYPVPYALAMARRKSIADDFIGIRLEDALEQSRKVETGLRDLEARGLIKTVDPKKILCPDGSCLFQAGGKLLYRDTNHLSIAGAEFVAPAIEPCFDMK